MVPTTSPTPSPTSAQNFFLTQDEFKETDDHEMACGDNAKVADWAFDIEVMGEGEVEELIKTLEIPVTSNGKFYFLTRNGQKEYSGSRVYFFENHAGYPPSNWLVHAQHYDLTLGSYFGIEGQVLCMR